MGYVLLIVESASKCKKIEGLLGGNYKCVATIGHIRSLSGGLASFHPETYEPRFKIDTSKRAQVAKIRKAVESASRVLLAADDDREGEAIAWHTCIVCGLKPETAERITFQEITKQALETAVANPRLINMNLVRAQQARQVLDLMVGYRVSPFLWQSIGSVSDKPLSAGRCQTPALRLVYENQLQIDSAKADIVYIISATFTERHVKMGLSLQLYTEEQVEEFLNLSINFEHMLTISKPVKSVQAPPSPLTTSLLQQKASSELRMSPKKTEELSQALYVAGLVTYIRTDRAEYSSEFIKEAKLYIGSNYGSNFIGCCASGNSGPGAQEAHEAIRPTSLAKREAGLNKDADRLYTLIWKNTVASCMKPHETSSLHLSMSAPKGCYKASIKKTVFDGWKTVYSPDPDTHFDYFLVLSTKKPFEPHKVTAALSIKNQKHRLNEAKLIKELELRGIGRPSTFPSLVTKIQERGYVRVGNIEGETVVGKEYTLAAKTISTEERKKKLGGERGRLILQPLGRMVIETLLDKSDSLFEYSFTSEMESRLDQIACGTESTQSLCQECSETIDEDIGKQKNDIVLDDNHTYIVSRYGPTVVRLEGDKKTYIQVDPNVDPLEVQKGLVPIQKLLRPNKNLGSYKGSAVELVSGTYGWYIKTKGSNISVKGAAVESMTLERAISLIENRFNRKITSKVSVRKGEYGYYVMYRTGPRSKPKFIKFSEGINQDSSDDEILSWLRLTHKLV